jgi:hypothetical protein
VASGVELQKMSAATFAGKWQLPVALLAQLHN